MFPWGGGGQATFHFRQSFFVSISTFSIFSKTNVRKLKKKKKVEAAV
jgi:hypothetical protein